MKRLFIGLLILGSVSSFAQYQNSEDEGIPKIIESTLANIESFLRSRQDEVDLSYPEYSQAFNHFKDEVAESSHKNSVIINDLNNKISIFSSELAELKRQYEKNPSYALKKLIHSKETTELARFKNDVNKEYQRFLKNIISLDNKLKVATKVKFKGFGTEQVILSIFPLLTPFTVTGIIPGLYAYKVVDNFNETISEHDADNDYSIFDSNRKLPEAKAARDEYLSSVAKRLFSECKTQRCVYFLAEDYINYINLISRLNVSSKNSNGLEFKKVQLLKKQTIRAIDKISRIAARFLPTGLKPL